MTSAKSGQAASGAVPLKDFPNISLLPKRDTKAFQFIQANPSYDGRNTIVAILDTGVDPGAIGLQTTSDGKPKVVDIVDATGSGDVDTSKVVKLEGDSDELTGLTGRKLKVNKAWKNPSGEYRLGLKRAYEFFPKDLVARVKEHRKKEFDEKQHHAVTEVQRKLSEWRQAHPSPSAEDLKESENLKGLLEELENSAKNYDDPGPIYDCVVWHDGSVWRAVLDSHESGDLSQYPALTNFRQERQYAQLDAISQMNYCLNIYDNGDTLSIVTDAGSHGTHVAGIVAAHHPGSPELNGVAPGAQIVAVKIGDSRLGSLETGVGLVRGFLAVLENKCDVINMSYGEPAALANTGRIVELAKEVVSKYGVIFVSSAGNEGPSLSTVGAPGGSSECCIGVGAYVSPEMMAAEYSLLEQLPGIAYTWSSRGPTFDGDLGVSICGPGGAISPVPNWTLNKNSMANGTSMSSPNVAGNIALLLSGLKAKSQVYTPYSIKRALENTAYLVPGTQKFAQGHGLVQVDKAFDYLQSHVAVERGLEGPLYYQIAVTDRDGARGIYLRQPSEFAAPVKCSVQVKPVFHEDADNRNKVEFELKSTLVPTASWVRCAEHFQFAHGGRSFDIYIDTSSLKPGCYYEEVLGYDSERPELGPVFRVPITVAKPEQEEKTIGDETVNYSLKTKAKFGPGEIFRKFIAVPLGATWLDLTIKGEGSPSDTITRLYFLHLHQILPHRPHREKFEKAFRLLPSAEETFTTPVAGGVTLEFCLAQFWSSLGASELTLQINFHGVELDKQQVTLYGGDMFAQVRALAPLRDEALSPSASLTAWQQKVRPTTATLAPLKDRDIWPSKNRQIYEIVLDYEFNNAEAGDVKIVFPFLNNLLYEAEYESQMCLLFDEDKKYLGASNFRSSALKLPKGKILAKLQVRHDDPQALEKLKGAVMTVERKLKDKLSLTVHHTQNAALLGGKKAGNKTLLRGQQLPFFVKEPDFDKLPKGVNAGDLLVGSVVLAKAGEKADSNSFVYVVPPAPTPEKKEEAKPEKKEEKPELAQTADAVRDLRVTRLSKLEGKADFDIVFQEVANDYPKHIPLLQTKLRHYDSDSLRSKSLHEVVTAADAVLEQINQDQLASHYGVKLLPEDEAANQLRKDMDSQKAALVDALARKARALNDLKKEEEFVATYNTLQKWADTASEDKLWRVYVAYETHKKRHGKVLKRLSKLLSDKTSNGNGAFTTKELKTAQIAALKELGWDHWVDYEAKWKILRTLEKFARF